MAKNRLHGIADFLEACRRILVNSVWIAVILVLLAALGWGVLSFQKGGKKGVDQQAEKLVKPLPPPVDWQEVDASVAEVMQRARKRARDYAAMELDSWIESMMERVDGSFLDWYFNYWTQQVLGLKGLYQYGVHYVLENQPTASEKLTEEIQQEFTARVLQPEIAQKTLERIASETARRYVATLEEELPDIPEKYGISRVRWQEYLEDIAITTASTEGGRQTPLTLKALTVSGAGGTVLLAANIKTMIGKLSGKMMAKSSGKMASAMATKTGGKVVAKVGGKFFGTIAGFGVLVWDVWDHAATEKENRPLLRESLANYFQELKLLLLDDPEYGIMSTFHAFERQLAERNRQPAEPQ